MGSPMTSPQAIEFTEGVPFPIAPQDAACHIFTYAEGVLSPVAHDLRIHVEGLSLTLNPRAGSVVFGFDPSTLRVDGAFDAHRQGIDTVAKRDKAKIEARIRDEVLDARRFAECALSIEKAKAPTSNTFEIHGLLKLRGMERPISALIGEEEDFLKTRVTIALSDYGIGPVTALFGALRVKDTIVVEFRLHSRFGDAIKETLGLNRS
jgi:hypothetical protein